jgi:hypothetical protein
MKHTRSPSCKPLLGTALAAAVVALVTLVPRYSGPGLGHR